MDGGMKGWKCCNDIELHIYRIKAAIRNLEFKFKEAELKQNKFERNPQHCCNVVLGMFLIDFYN